MTENENRSFRHIHLHRWRQFVEVNIDLHPRLTVLTGANGSGKSTILSILEGNLTCGQNDTYLATPIEDKSAQETKFTVSTIFRRFYPFLKSRPPSPKHIEQEQIGRIDFHGLDTCEISLPPPARIHYKLEFSKRAKIAGFKIGSHRPTPKYQAVQDIPISGIKPKEAFDYFRQSSRKYESGEALRKGNNSVSNPISPLKQTLISFAMHGSSNKNVKAVPEIVGLFDEFQETLCKVLPREIRFKKLEGRPPEVLVVTDTGDFPIDGSSGGLMSLIQTSWQIFLFTKANTDKCVVLIDEPENHLHPSLQREFLSLIVNAFSNVQFIVATHSPFIISSVKDSFVYALRFNEFTNENLTSQDNSYAVTSTRIELNNSAGTAARILDEVLGVSVTMPIWAEKRMHDIVDRFNKATAGEEAVESLRQELEAEGLSEFLPQAITRLLK